MDFNQKKEQKRNCLPFLLLTTLNDCQLISEYHRKPIVSVAEIG